MKYSMLFLYSRLMWYKTAYMICWITADQYLWSKYGPAIGRRTPFGCRPYPTPNFGVFFIYLCF